MVADKWRSRGVAATLSEPVTASNPSELRVERTDHDLEVGRAPRRAPKTSVLLAIDLVNHIVSEDYPEGTLLAHEKEMADQLGVARATVREALRLLESRGVVRIRSGPNGGPVVRAPRPADFAGALELVLQFDHATVADVVRARDDMAPLAARLAAGRATAAQISSLADARAALEQALAQPELFPAATRDCEASIADASGDLVLQIVLGGVSAMLSDALPPSELSEERRTETSRILSDILRSIETGDADAAESQMEHYVRSTSGDWATAHPDLLRRAVRWHG